MAAIHVISRNTNRQPLHLSQPFLLVFLEWNCLKEASRHRSYQTSIFLLGALELGVCGVPSPSWLVVCATSTTGRPHLVHEGSFADSQAHLLELGNDEHWAFYRGFGTVHLQSRDRERIPQRHKNQSHCGGNAEPH